MKINISNSVKRVSLGDAESGKAFVVTVDAGAANVNRISCSLCELWNNTVAVVREGPAGRRELIRVGGGEYHIVLADGPLGRCLILTEIKELTVVI